MKVSGRIVADTILQNLQQQIQEKFLKPKLAIIMTTEDPASRLYVDMKIKAAQKIGVEIEFVEFAEHQLEVCKKTLCRMDEDSSIHGIIIQYPIYKTWNFEELMSLMNPKKDVDGFLPESPFKGATALGVWEMLKAFANIEGSSVEEFLRSKNVVLLGKGRTAGGPIRDVLLDKGVQFNLIDSKTENSGQLIKNADVVISATGKKNIISGDKIKEGSFVIGVGVGKEEGKIFGDIEEESVSKKAKLYCPTIGGIGPLTIACLLRNVVESSHGFHGQYKTAGGSQEDERPGDGITKKVSPH